MKSRRIIFLHPKHEKTKLKEWTRHMPTRLLLLLGLTELRNLVILYLNIYLLVLVEDYCVLMDPSTHVGPSTYVVYLYVCYIDTRVKLCLPICMLYCTPVLLIDLAMSFVYLCVIRLVLCVFLSSVDSQEISMVAKHGPSFMFVAVD